MYPEGHLENMQLVILPIETLFASCFHTFLCLLSIFNDTQGRYKIKMAYKYVFKVLDVIITYSVSYENLNNVQYHT